MSRKFTTSQHFEELFYCIVKRLGVSDDFRPGWVPCDKVMGITEIHAVEYSDDFYGFNDGEAICMQIFNNLLLRIAVSHMHLVALNSLLEIPAHRSFPSPRMSLIMQIVYAKVLASATILGCGECFVLDVVDGSANVKSR
jgi:hypothetical protein